MLPVCFCFTPFLSQTYGQQVTTNALCHPDICSVILQMWKSFIQHLIIKFTRQNIVNFL